MNLRSEENDANDGMGRLPAKSRPKNPGALTVGSLLPWRGVLSQTVSKLERPYHMGEGTNELISPGGPPQKPASDLR
jgi:hypothetical protein